MGNSSNFGNNWLSCSDVSICLGLSVAGDDVVFDNELCGEVGLLFPSKEIKITHIIERMRNLVSEANHVESVCRLHGLLCLAVLYFPRTSRLSQTYLLGY